MEIVLPSNAEQRALEASKYPAFAGFALAGTRASLIEALKLFGREGTGGSTAWLRWRKQCREYERKANRHVGGHHVPDPASQDSSPLTGDHIHELRSADVTLSGRGRPEQIALQRRST